MYLLDSDVIIHHLNGRDRAQEFLENLMNEPVHISSVTFMEVVEGIPLNADPELASRRWQILLGGIVLLPFDEAEATRAAQARRDMRAQNLSVRARVLDIMIAATALEHELVLATNNPADYRGISGLQITTP